MKSSALVFLLAVTVPAWGGTPMSEKSSELRDAAAKARAAIPAMTDCDGASKAFTSEAISQSITKAMHATGEYVGNLLVITLKRTSTDPTMVAAAEATIKELEAQLKKRTDYCGSMAIESGKDTAKHGASTRSEPVPEINQASGRSTVN